MTADYKIFPIIIINDKQVALFLTVLSCNFCQIDKSVEGTLSVEELTESAIAISEVLTEAHANTRASQERVRQQTK